MAKHPFNRVDYRGKRVEIDREIVPLMKEIWKAGIGTIWSCQDQEGYVAVGLADMFGAQDLVGAVQAHAPHDVVARANEGLNALGRDPGDAAWQFSIYPHTLEFDALLGGPPTGVSCCHFVFTVRFPRSDLQYVVAALQQANAQAQAQRLLTSADLLARLIKRLEASLELSGRDGCE
jgi:hypothetical protein